MPLLTRIIWRGDGVEVRQIPVGLVCGARVRLNIPGIIGEAVVLRDWCFYSEKDGVKAFILLRWAKRRGGPGSVSAVVKESWWALEDLLPKLGRSGTLKDT